MEAPVIHQFGHSTSEGLRISILLIAAKVMRVFGFHSTILGIKRRWHVTDAFQRGKGKMFLTGYFCLISLPKTLLAYSQSCFVQGVLLLQSTGSCQLVMKEKFSFDGFPCLQNLQRGFAATSMLGNVNKRDKTSVKPRMANGTQAAGRMREALLRMKNLSFAIDAMCFICNQIKNSFAS